MVTAAAVVFFAGVALLVGPWDGVLVALGWLLIVAAGVTASLTLFFVRIPPT